MAEEFLYKLKDSSVTYNTVILDGGGINNNYNKRIIFALKSSYIKCIYFDTPVEVCIKRLENRERKVPIDNIYDKNIKMVECVHYYKSTVNEFITVRYFSNKYLFLEELYVPTLKLKEILKVM